MKKQRIIALLNQCPHPPTARALLFRYSPSLKPLRGNETTEKIRLNDNSQETRIRPVDQPLFPC
ncbi:hypothetical protein CUMW_038680 [Citrus unshiu]|nr:hypothetical protein CUMW_038680 [Citrus unshiu]